MFLTAFVSVLLVTKTLQQSGRDPVNNVCRRHKHQTCIIDSKLYIDGGLAYYGGSKDNASAAEQNTYLLWEDVSNATMTKFGFPDQYANLSKDPEVPSVSGGVLWADEVNKLFYLFGGEYFDIDEVKRRDGQGSGFTLWFYDTAWDSWNKSKRHGSQDGIRWPAFGAGAVSDRGDAYFYGGYLTNTSDFKTDGLAVMQNSLITYNMDSRQWTNQTWDQTRRAEGTMHYIPASEGGMLVYLGGLEMNDTSKEARYADMSQVHLYDIANPRWYTQTATGDIPLARKGFCSGVVWAKDKSSYNIYLFGGFGDPNGTGLGDLYVLSVPSFQWILIWPTPQQFIFPGGKGYGSCNVFRESQMIIIGGLLTNASVGDCDAPSIGGQHGMLLGQENVEQGGDKGPTWWHAPMDNLTGYRVPDQVVARIGGDTNGNAASTVPAKGWATQDLAKYLGTTFAAQARTTMSGRVLPTTAAPSPSATPPGKRTNAGAIAGGAVGAAIVLVSVIAGVLLFLRRRKRKQSPSSTSEPPEVVNTSHARSPDMTHKSLATASTMPGSTLASLTTHSPAYSPQGSPPPPASSLWGQDMHMPVSCYQGSPSPQQQSSPSPQHHQSGDWGHQGGFSQAGNYPQGAHTYQQTYYPPPADPSTSSASPVKETFAHMSSIQEMPNVRSPANVVAEMSDIRSPAPRHG